MKYKIYFFIAFLLLPLLVAYSQTTIYLKSGQTISGKLVKEGEDSIKIDYYGSELTFWRDDIKEIAKDEAATAGPLAAGTLEKIYKDYILSLKNRQWLEVKKYVTPKRWNELLKQENRQQILTKLGQLAPPSFRTLEEKAIAEDKAELTITSDSLTENVDKVSSDNLGPLFSMLKTSSEESTRGTVQFTKQDDQWRISKIDWRFSQELTEMEKSKDDIQQQKGATMDKMGMVTGILDLPLTAVSKAIKGVVFISFKPISYKEADSADYKQSNPEVYTLVFNSDDIASRLDPPQDTQLKYTLSLAPGKYQARALWDLTPPYCESSWSGCPAAEGDYTEPIQEKKEPQPIEIKTGELTKGVDFDCTSHLGSANDSQQRQ